MFRQVGVNFCYDLGIMASVRIQPEYCRRPGCFCPVDSKFDPVTDRCVFCLAASEYITGADFSFSVYGFINHGSGKMIEIFGTQKQKDMFDKLRAMEEEPRPPVPYRASPPCVRLHEG